MPTELQQRWQQDKMPLRLRRQEERLPYAHVQADRPLDPLYRRSVPRGAHTSRGELWDPPANEPEQALNEQGEVAYPPSLPRC